MSQRDNDDRLRRELEEAADALFDALDPYELATLVSRFGSSEKLRGRAAALAEKVIRNLDRDSVRVPAAEYVRLVAATLTLSPNGAGVLKRVDHATRKFQTYSRFHELAPEILVRMSRLDANANGVIEPLVRSLHLVDELLAHQSVEEPRFVLQLVVPAFVLAVEDAPKEPVAVGGSAEAAVRMLERGVRLAAAYRDDGRRCPGAHDELPVLGNADFLLRIAAYRVAIEECLDPSATKSLDDPRKLDDLEKAVVQLTDTLRSRMTRPPSWLRRNVHSDPDVMVALEELAFHLGNIRNDVERGARARKVYLQLSDHIRLAAEPRRVPPQIMRAPRGNPGKVAEVDHLVGWVVAALFEGAERKAWLPLREWLTGNRKVDLPPDLPLLLRRLRVAEYHINRVTDEPRQRPAALPPQEYRMITTRLAAEVDPAEIDGCSRGDARRVLLDTLPPLWTRRWPVSRLVASQLRLRDPDRPKSSGPTAVIATAGARGPVQAVQATEKAQEQPCCAESARGSRQAGEQEPRQPAQEQSICPHRPWGEIGWVESYHTLGEVGGSGAAAARKQLERYRGPWLELLLEVRKDLNPGDLGPEGEQI